MMYFVLTSRCFEMDLFTSQPLGWFEILILRDVVSTRHYDVANTVMIGCLRSCLDTKN